MPVAAGGAVESLLAIEFDQRADKLVDISLHELVDLVQRQADAVIGHPALRKIIGANPLVAATAADERPPLLRTLLIDLLLLVLEDAAAKLSHRLGFVLVLALFILALNDNAGRQVRDANRAFGLVDLLAARAAGAHRVDLQILIADVDLHLGNFRQHGDGGGARVNAALSLGLGNALHAMSAALELQLLEGSFASHREDDFLQSAQFGRAEIQNLVLPTAFVGEPLIHIEQLAGKQGRFVAAGAGANLHNQGAACGRVAGGGEIFQLGFERLLLSEKLLELGLGVFAGLVVFFLVEQHARGGHVVQERVITAHGPGDLNQPALLALQRQELGRVTRVRRILEHPIQFVVAFELGFKTGIHGICEPERGPSSVTRSVGAQALRRILSYAVKIRAKAARRLPVGAHSDSNLARSRPTSRSAMGPL